MWKGIDVTGKGIEAKGRNGYFKVAKVEVWDNGEGGVELSLFSNSRLAQNAPARVFGPGKEIARLLREIIRATKETKGGYNGQRSRNTSQPDISEPGPAAQAL
jgi:hypothetical protein